MSPSAKQKGSNSRPAFYKRTLLIDHNIQVPLMFYYICGTIIGVLAFASSSLALTMYYYSDNGMAVGYITLAVTLIVSFVIYLYVGLFITNKVAGPLFRLKGHLAAIRRGEMPTKMVTREGDFIDEIIQEYNLMVEKLNGGEQQAAAPKLKEGP